MQSIHNNEWINEREKKKRGKWKRNHRSWIALEWETRESRIRMALDQSLEAQSLANSTRSEVAAAAGGGGGGAMGHVRCTDQWCDDGFFWKGNLRGGNVIAIARAVMKWRRRWIVEECCADLGKLGWEREIEKEGECLKSNGERSITCTAQRVTCT